MCEQKEGSKVKKKSCTTWKRESKTSDHQNMIVMIRQERKSPVY